MLAVNDPHHVMTWQFWDPIMSQQFCDDWCHSWMDTQDSKGQSRVNSEVLPETYFKKVKFVVVALSVLFLTGCLELGKIHFIPDL